MFSRRFTTFRPAKGVFKAAIQPYRRWYDRTEMSAAFELNGQVYRIVATIQFWKHLYSKYAIACDEQGNVIYDEDTTRHCFRIYTYLSRFVMYKSNLYFDVQQGRRGSKHKPLIEAFQEVNETLAAQLTEQERQHFTFHLFYLQEVFRLSQSIGRYATEMLKMEKQLNSLKPDYMSSALVEEVIDLIESYSLERDKLLIVLFEDTEPRKTVQQVLQRSVKANKVPYRYRRWILNEIYEASAASKRLLTEVQIRTETSSLQGTIDHLKNLSSHEEPYVEIVIQSLLDENWPTGRNR